MIKVLYIAQTAVTRGKVTGGVEAVTENLLESFSNKGELSMTILSFRKDKIEDFSSKYSDNVQILHYGKKYNFDLINIVLFQRKIVKQIIKKKDPDIIHFHGTGPNILSITNLPKDNIILTQHGINRIELKFQLGLKNKLKFLIKCLIENFYFKKFKNYIFTSESNRLSSEKYFKSKYDQFPIISNPVNSNFYSVQKSSNINNTILYVGHISKLKNLLLLIRALHKLRDKDINFYLHIVGSIKDKSYYNECKKYINNNNLSETLKFHGYLDQDEIVKLYNEIDILILPSLQENNPVTVLEAMAAGKVAIASNVGGISENIENGINGYIFEKNDLNTMIDILAQIYKNPEQINEVGSQARIYAIQSFDPDRIAGKLIDCYKDALASNYFSNE